MRGGAAEAQKWQRAFLPVTPLKTKVPLAGTNCFITTLVTSCSPAPPCVRRGLGAGTCDEQSRIWVLGFESAERGPARRYRPSPPPSSAALRRHSAQPAPHAPRIQPARLLRQLAVLGCHPPRHHHGLPLLALATTLGVTAQRHYKSNGAEGRCRQASSSTCSMQYTACGMQYTIRTSRITDNTRHGTTAGCTTYDPRWSTTSCVRYCLLCGMRCSRR
jgi:hypothetical protein